MRTRNACLCLLMVVSALLYCPAQAPAGAENNAALYYWNAFAQMSDLPLNDAQVRHLETVASGVEPWDENTFGKLLDDNAGAVETMVRGTRMPYCVWGVERELGPVAPIPQIGRGRALARLNILTAQRLAARGDSKGAATHLIAGIRFARDLASGTSLIGALAGKLAIVSDFRAAEALAGKLSAQDRTAIVRAVRNLPPGVFDWSDALAADLGAVRTGLIQLSRSKNPEQIFVKWGESSPKSGSRVTDSDVRQFEPILREAIQVFQKSPADAQIDLQQLQKEIERLNSPARDFIPSLRGMNEARRQLEETRQAFLRRMENTK